MAMLQRKIESASVNQLIITAVILAAVILLFLNRHWFISQFLTDD